MATAFWDNVTGAGVAMSEQIWANYHHWLMAGNNDDAGVLEGVGDELALSGTTSPLGIGSGAAYVRGIPYWGAATTAAYSTPVVGTTGKLVVLRATWATATIAPAVISSADGDTAIPSPTQMWGTTWEIPLYELQVDTSGNVASSVDVRVPISGPSTPRLPKLVARRTGPTSDDWSEYDVAPTDYLSAADLIGGIQFGVALLTLPVSTNEATATITLPIPYTPGVAVPWASIMSGGESPIVPATIEAKPNVTNPDTQIDIKIKRADQSTTDGANYVFAWVTLGPLPQSAELA